MPHCFHVPILARLHCATLARLRHWPMYHFNVHMCYYDQVTVNIIYTCLWYCMYWSLLFSYKYRTSVHSDCFVAFILIGTSLWSWWRQSTPRSWWWNCWICCLLGKRKCCKVDEVHKVIKIACPECWQDCRIIFKTARISFEICLRVNIMLLSAQWTLLQQSRGLFDLFTPGPPFHQRYLLRLKGTLTRCCLVSKCLFCLVLTKAHFKSSLDPSHQRYLFSLS